MRRSDYDTEEGSIYAPSSTSGSDDGGPGTHVIGIPFILGTTASDKEISKIQRVVNRMVGSRKWEPHNHRTEHQGTALDIDYYWLSIRREYGGNHHEGGADDGKDGGYEEGEEDEEDEDYEDYVDDGRSGVEDEGADEERVK